MVTVVMRKDEFGMRIECIEIRRKHYKLYISCPVVQFFHYSVNLQTISINTIK